MLQKLIIVTSLLFCVPCFAAEGPIELPPELQTDPQPVAKIKPAAAQPIVDNDLDRRVRILESWSAKMTDYANGLNKRILSEDDVVAIVRREFAQLTIRQANGQVIKQSVSVPDTSTPFSMPSGGVITHINGQPVAQAAYQSQAVNARVVRSYTPQVEVRSYSAGGRTFGFLRSRRAASSCRIVNGVQVCN